MNTSKDKLPGYLRDLIYLIKERASEEITTKTPDFTAGEIVGYQHVLDMIENQAVAFEIDLDEIGFFDFEKYMNRKK